MLKGKIVSGSADVATKGPYLRLDIELDAGESVNVYHHPRETNVDSTVRFLDQLDHVKFTKAMWGTVLQHPLPCHVAPKVEEDGRVSYNLVIVKRDETTLGALYGSRE